MYGEYLNVVIAILGGVIYNQNVVKSWKTIYFQKQAYYQLYNKPISI